MTDDKKRNPWRLTPAECRSLDGLVKYGSTKDAALMMDLSERTIDTHVEHIKLKMDVKYRLQAVLEWDRFTRDEERKAQNSVWDWRKAA